MRRFLLFLCLLPVLSWADVHYTLTPQPQAQSVLVSVRLETTEPDQSFHIPAWCPGFYFLQRYEQNLSDIRAANGAGQALQIGPGEDARSWVVSNPTQGPMTFSYRVLGNDPGLGFFGVNVRSDSTFVNGPATFVYPQGRKNERCSLKLTLPRGWDVATAMQAAEEDGFEAPDYDEFIDHPLQLGKMQRRPFEVAGIPFEVVFVTANGLYPTNQDEVVEELKQLSLPAIKLFGSAPFRKYLYIVHLAVGNFNGGLEHRACNVIATNNNGRLSLGTLASHEYFHAWNVKQIRPKILGPFDYTQEQRTGNLWFAEGVTDYYAYLTAYRSGRYDEAWLLDSFSSQIYTLQSGRTRKRITLERACRETWEHGGFGYDDLDYYNKGLISGLVFDAAIREATDGAKSLDDVMRLLYQKHKLPHHGYEEDGILRAINEVSGKDLSALYRTIVQSTDEVPFEVLQGIGLRVLEIGKPVPVFGAAFKEGVVASTSDALAEAGLLKGDSILELDGQSFAMSLFAGMKIGQAYKLKVQRSGQIIELKMRMESHSPREYRLERDPFASEPTSARLSEYLIRPNQSR
ncbi:MAG: M61 family metallopeptidase [Armatimonadetes bacterium]|nr:M61 family metallopeptidase [Armatimonadota bacterium]